MTQEWKPASPYNTLPLLPPQAELESRAVLKQCVRSAAALAELNRAAELIPNPDVLISTLPLLEAQASSEIENVVTTTDQMFRYLQTDAAADSATKEALRYRHALMEAFGALRERPLGVTLARAICSRIKGAGIDVRHGAGIMIAKPSTAEIIYTPPADADTIRALLANWEQFIHTRDDLEPLVRMAVAHYQFEAIHPFPDGNGRTGRVINTLLLVEHGLLDLPILYLSRFIIQNKQDYYDLLLRVTRDGAWEEWIVYMLRGVEETAHWTLAKIEAIRALIDRTIHTVRTNLPKIYSRELIDAIFLQPYCRIANLVDAGIAKRQAASRYLKALANAGVLEEHEEGRDKLWLHTELLRLLTRG
ncbi:MAG: protein adenylyltransferase Fic [Planctomycetota bacterium]|jgi:Fic family protein